MQTYKNKKSGYTLIELLIVIAIMTMLIVMAIPFDLSYRKKVELKNSTKQLRGIFWEAQSRALAPSSKYATSYKINLIKDAATGHATITLKQCLTTPPATTETCTDILGSQEFVTLGTNITVKNITMTGGSVPTPTSLITSFLVGNGRTAGQISFIPVATSADIQIGSLLDSTLKYDIIIDGATSSITYK